MVNGAVIGRGQELRATIMPLYSALWGGDRYRLSGVGSAAMYRVIATASVALFLAACSSNSGSTSNPFSFEAPKNPFTFEGPKDTINFESQPPGAEAKTSTGQSCRTPCALAVPADKAFSVTFTLAGFQTATEEVQLVSMGDGTSKLRPDPVLVELTPAAPAPKKKAPAKKVVTTPPKSTAPARAAPPAMTPAQQPQTTSPWPNTPPPQSR